MMSHILRPTTLALVALLAVVWGCSTGQFPTEPLDENPGAEGAVLQGEVLGTEGRPASGAVLALETMREGLTLTVARARTGNHDPVDKAAGVRSAVSDDEGKFIFDGLAAGSYLLTSQLRDHAGHSRALEILPEAVANAETTFVDIQLTPTGTFLGNAALENAVDHAGTVVFLEGTSYVAVTDAAGDYSLTGVPVGSWPTRAMHSGFRDDNTLGTLNAAGDSVTLAALFLRLESNIPPGILTISASTVPAQTPTQFDATAYDNDGTIVLYEWDFENDGIFDWSDPASPACAHVYQDAWYYLAKLRVTDNDGGIALQVVVVEVDPPLPTAAHVAPDGLDSNPGTRNSPVLTIGRGMVVAATLASDSVYVAQGTYIEVVNLHDTIEIVGGCDRATWQPQVGVYSILTGGPSPMAAGLIDFPLQVTVANFEVIATSGTVPGEPSIAVAAVNCTGALRFLNCKFTAGNGFQGTAGSAGANAIDAEDGRNGFSGDCNLTNTNPGGPGGLGAYPGGAGGHGGNQFANGQNGGQGSGGTGPLFTPGANGGATGDPGGDGFSASGAGGGVNGSGGLASPTAGGGFPYWPATFGDAGAFGGGGSGGGGGGGGGGFQFTLLGDGVGNSGGGGGGGGFGGQGGGGGQGGSASIGFLSINSVPTLFDCVITTGQGGDGGAGGDGGFGGNGGGGGIGANWCIGQIGRGGNGGGGGSGGQGGGGAGGWGGPSVGIWSEEGSGPFLSGTTVYNIGNGGSGGPGGNPGGQTAPNGESGDIH